ncbi:MAG: flagellar protein FlaG [Ferrimonas sp.]
MDGVSNTGLDLLGSSLGLATRANTASAALPFADAHAQQQGGQSHNGQPRMEPTSNVLVGELVPTHSAKPSEQSPAAEAAAEAKMDVDQLQQMVAELESFFNANKRSLSFQIDDDSGKSVVTIKEVDTDEIIRQIPSEEMLKFAVKLSDLSGLFLNTKI